MLFNLAHGIPEVRICFRQSHAIQNKSHGRHFKALQGIQRAKHLRARCHARLNNHDGTIDKARQVFRLRGDSQRSSVSQHQALSLHLGLRGHPLQ